MEEQPVDTTLYSLSDCAPSPGDRRESERHLTLFRVGTIVIDEHRELCLIKNISAGGMLIKAYSRISQGDRVSVELKQGEAISGSVSWIEEDSAGIAFDQRVDVIALLAASMEGPRPRMPRVAVRCIASVRQDGAIYGMRARDVSQGGVKIDSQRELTVGGEVVVTLPGLSPIPGVVRWSDSGCYGVTFNRLLALPELVGWLQDQRDLLKAAG